MITTSGSDPASPIAPTPLPQVPVTLDTKGRVRVSKEQRRLVLAEFERSGISTIQFARRAGIKYSTFAGWLQRHRRAQSKAQPRTTRLLEAVVEQAQLPMPSNGTALLLQLPGGARAELSDPKQAPLAAALLRALSQPC